METYERDLRVRAPLSDVWAFHSTIDGLRSLTPEFVRLRVHDIDRPNNDRDAHVLSEGTCIHMSVKPFGVGPRVSWTSRIVERVERDGAAYFVDEMEAGPFPEWRHTHLFYGDAGETLVHDHLEYRAPLGADALAKPTLAAMFAYRHRRTSEILGGP